MYFVFLLSQLLENKLDNKCFFLFVTFDFYSCKHDKNYIFLKDSIDGAWTIRLILDVYHSSLFHEKYGQNWMKVFILRFLRVSSWQINNHSPNDETIVLGDVYIDVLD